MAATTRGASRAYPSALFVCQMNWWRLSKEGLFSTIAGISRQPLKPATLTGRWAATSSQQDTS